jgi:hypothetical protein
MDTFVTHDQLLIILLLVFIGATIFAYAMLKHAIELRNITTKVIEDLSIVQGVIDAELTVNLAEQQLAIDAIGVNLANLNTNSGITFIDLEIIKNSKKFGLGSPGNIGLEDVTLNGWQLFPII